MKTFFSIIFLIAVFCGLIGSFIKPESDVVSGENRARVKFPEFEIYRAPKEYFTQIDRFATDNLPLRDRFITGYRWIVNASGDQVNANKSFRGRDGWFFLGNDYNQTIEKLEGRISPDAEHSGLVNRIISISDWSRLKGMQAVFVLGPSKSSIHPEKLPAIIKPSKQRHITPFLERLRSHQVQVVDPTAALRAKKQTDVVYFYRDTHWNQVGASVAFGQVVQALGLHDCPFPRFEKAEIHRGDLVNIGLFEEPAINADDNFRAVWAPPITLSEEIIEETGIPRQHRTRIIDNKNPTYPDAVWIIGDSFRTGMAPIVSACFSRTTSTHFHHNNNEKLRNAYAKMPVKPTHVIVILTERRF